MQTGPNSSEVSINPNNLKISTVKTSHELPGAEEPSLLAYTNSPITTSVDNLVFPIPPTRTTHPYAPRAPENIPLLGPAIHRPTTNPNGSVGANAGHRALLNTLAMAAHSKVHGPHPGPGTIHGRTSQDLLSSEGPVPIKFDVTPHKSPIIRQSSAPLGSASSSPRHITHLQPSPSMPSNDKPLERTDFSPTVQTTRPRSRSFSAIITAIETPSYSPIGSLSPGFFEHTNSVYHSHSLPATPKPEEHEATFSKSTASFHDSSAKPLPTPKLPRKLSKPTPLNITARRADSDDAKGPEPVLSPSLQTWAGPLQPQGPSSAPVTALAFGQSDRPLDKPRSVSSLRRQTNRSTTASAELNVIETESASSYRDDILEDYGVKLNPHPQHHDIYPVDGSLPSATASSSGYPSSPKSHNSRTQSLQSKLSMSGMRHGSHTSRRRAEQGPSRMDDDDMSEEEVVEVDDMEFTLIRPTLIRHPPPHQDEEQELMHQQSPLVDREGFLAPQDSGTIDRDSSRSYSPSLSPMSPTSPPPMSPFQGSFPPSLMPSSSSSTTREPAITIATSPVNAKYRELHRQLESKWLSAMNSTPSAEAKKSRKIRKLVLDGIPASVRGVVWLYLTDSKGRRMPGLYEKLCMRGKVAASDEIWMDIQSHFSGHIHLCDPDGPLMSLLQAYFCMVPDTEYNYSLSLVAGHVLLQTPEEDAFWTFVALMDNHLRGYFSSVARLLEIDSLLFEKALNTYDKSIAVRLFNTLQVSPLELCRNWFPSLFSVTLPSSHLNRTWDVIMLFETAPILFRIGLAIISFAQPYIMNPARCRTGAEALAYLSQPPAEIFPPDPDQIVQTAMSVKLKEDELRKMRSKVEHEVRKRSVLPRTATFR